MKHTLAENHRLRLARHLAQAVPGLEDRLFLPGGRGVSDEAAQWVKGPEVSATERILGLIALDIWNGSGGTILGEALEVLSHEDMRRTLDTLKALI